MSESGKKKSFFATLVRSTKPKVGVQQVSTSTNDTKRQNDDKPIQRKPVERRESTRLQNAAKLLRNLSKSRLATDSSNDKSHSSDNNKSNSEKIKDRRASSVVSLNENCDKSGGKRSHRSHSFHGGRSTEQKKKDKMAANLNRRESERNMKDWPRKSKDDLVEFCGNSVYVDLSELSTRHHARNSAIVEPTIPGAKSILLTEDNLSNYVDYSTLGSKRRMSTADLEPDLIQDLPSKTGRTSDFDSSPIYSSISTHQPRRLEGSQASQNAAAAACWSTTNQPLVQPQIGAGQRSQSIDSLPSEDLTLQSPQYSDHLRNSSYSLLTQPQSLMLTPAMNYQQHQPPNYVMSSNSGASSLPYISRSLSIDAYTQQQLELKKSQKCSELEEYAKRYESFSKRRGNMSTSSTASAKLLWQRNPCNPVPEEEIPDYGRESVTSNSSNETLRYRDSLDDTVLQPPSEFLNNNNNVYKDLKRFPLQTYSSEQSLKKLPECTNNKSVPNLQDSGGANASGMDENPENPENYSFLDPDKRLRVSDNTLKLIQKQALLDYYERHKPSPCSSTSPQSGSGSNSSGCSGGSASGISGQIDPDSGFYSPTERERPPSAVINGEDHPDTSSTRLNGLELEESSISILREDEEDDAEVGDILNDEEINNILEDDDDDDARPVYLQERYSSNSPNHGSSTTPVRDRSENQQPQQRWSIASSNVSRQSSSMPPERPPKKPHLRGSSDSATPPITPPRGVTPSNNSSRPASRASSNATPPSRGTTPTSSIIRNNRPKYPSPPGSPEKSRLQETPLPPPPPMETNFDYDTPSEKSSIQSMPLPPPPAPVSKAEVETVVSIEDKPTLRIRDKELQTPKDDLGREGKYRRTSSPTICSTPNIRPSSAASSQQSKSQNFKSPAKTPKRDSPATIAAKGAPGWEKFLGGKTSTVQFTSEEVQKLKKQHQNQQPHTPPAPPPKPRTSASGLLESSFDDGPPVPISELTNKSSNNIGLHSKSTPSLEHNPQLSPRSSTSEPPNSSSISVGISHSKHQTPNSRWKNSLDSLRHHPEQDGIPRGYTAAPNQPSHLWTAGPATSAVSHSHSNSDSGLSSLSGRTSTMSPISTMSTVSSVSSASSSGSSSRASLRSASIVSSCTIPLDEEEEEEVNSDPSTSPAGTILSKQRKISKLPEESQCELLAQQLLEMLPTNDEATYKKLVSLIGMPTHPKTSTDYMEGNIEDSTLLKDQSSHGHHQANHTKRSKIPASHPQILRKKEELISKISNKLEMLRAELTHLKAESKTNEEAGRQVTVKVMQVAQPNECEKYKLHVEEIDKITSLLHGLAGRLARADNSYALCSEASEKEQLLSKRNKLADQLDEAKKLKSNIDKRSSTVLSILRKYLSDQDLSEYENFIRTKARLIMETRQLNDKITLSEEQKTILKESLLK